MTNATSSPVAGVARLIEEPRTARGRYRWMLCLLVALAGCVESKLPPSVESEKTAASSAVTKADEKETERSNAAANEKAHDRADSSSPSDQSSAANKSSAGTPTIEELPAERFLVIAPGGPLVIEISVSIDGQPHDAAMQRLVDEVLKVADTDGDGRPTWKEVANGPRFIYGQMGNVPITGAAERRRLIDLYDRNKDGQMNRREVRRFVTRNNGSGRGFYLRTSNYYRGYNRHESPLRRWIDVDQDDVLSSEEIDAAPVRMAMRDADVDAILYPSDFKTTRSQARDSMPRRRRRGPDSAYSLDDGTDWRLLLFGLKEVYAQDGPLGPESFPLLPGLFEKLDTDQSNSLSEKELAALGTIEPHLQLAARFGQTDDADSSLGRLSLTAIDNASFSADAVVTQHVDALAIELPGVELSLAINDRAIGDNLLETARTQVAAYDTDSNGYLEADEFPAAAARVFAPFEAVDSNGDSKVYPAEVAALAEQRQAAVRSQVHATIGDQEDALFFALDTDNDGRLTAREIAGAGRRLRGLISDGSSELSYLEIPGCIAMIFARGESPPDEAMFQGLGVATQPAGAAPPRWFIGMDANGDGDVSPEEFPGTVEEFQRLDANGDGFVDPEEAGDASANAPLQTTSDS